MTIPENFLAPEEKCGHYITEQVKKLWKAEIDCLQQLQKICKKHDIRYFAGGGTLLGAVRHQGFIPWDDDIDVFMLSEDYRRFCEIAPKELEEPYFFQHFTTQPGYGPSKAKIRKSDTTACTNFEYEYADENFNLGIFIDILPLTPVCGSKLGRKLQAFIVRQYRTAVSGYENLRILKKSGPVRFKQYFKKNILYWKVCSLFMNHSMLSRQYLAACSLGGKKAEEVGLISALGFQEKYIYKKAWLDERVALPFEYIEVDCPAEYDKLLSHQFGDYMVFEKGTELHATTIIDPDTPYKEKMKQIQEEQAGQTGN